MTVDRSRRLQSVYVPMGDGVRLAVDVWLPAERTAVGGTVRTTGPAEPVRLGVPRTFGRSDALRVVPGRPMGLTVQLLPVSAVVPAGHRIRVAMAGHDASCFTRYGPAEETFTLELGSDSHLDLPVRGMNAGRPELDPRMAGDVSAGLERVAGSSAPVAAVRNLGA